MDAVWLGFSSKNYKMNCASKNWQPIAEINMGKNIEAISSWCGRLATLPKCNDQHCQRTNPPFLCLPSCCSSDGKKENSLQNSNHLSRASLIRSFSIWRREKAKRKNVQHFSFDIYQNSQKKTSKHSFLISFLLETAC